MKKTSNSRIKNIYLNSTVAIITQVIQIFMAFVIRKFFIDTLDIKYLGYNSVFSNILQMLNLAELGIGVAITSFLYEPLASGDEVRISALMRIYKKIYCIVGIVVLLIGVTISFFLNGIIPDATCDLAYLRVLFLINLLGTVSTYFFAYKRTLIVADQKAYIANFVDTIVSLCISICQIILLLTVPNYIVYLVLNIAKNTISNLILFVKSDKIYENVDRDIDESILSEYKSMVVNYIKDVFISRFGATIYYGTDNVILSIFKGSLLSGYLSNYTMITVQLTAIINQVFSSIQSTFGNFVNSDKKLCDQRRMADNYFFVSFYIANFCAICFMFLVQPFIALYFGDFLLLNSSTVIWLAVNLLLTIMIQIPSQIFTVYKLFRYDRPIIIISILLNITISVILVQKIGIDGVLIGTFVTSLIYLFSRFFIISKYVYRIPYRNYICRIFIYGCVFVITTVIVEFATKDIGYGTVAIFIFRIFMVGILAVFVPASILTFTNEFSFLLNRIVPYKCRRFCKSYIFLGVSILIIAISVCEEKIDSSKIYVNNKSHSLRNTYNEEVNRDVKVFHLSFDDTIQIFEDITNNNYLSVFENSTLAWFKSLHDKYDIVISCYVYYENENFSLSQCTNQYKQEFIENSNWLRFGFHTLNKDTIYNGEHSNILNDYNKTINELKRIIGTECIDHIVRLQSFQGTEDDIQKLTSLDDEAIVGLLTADDLRSSYALSKSENEYLQNHDFLKKDGIIYYSTDLRVEHIEDVDKKIEEMNTNVWNDQKKYMIVFTHEWQINSDIQHKIEILCQWAVENGYVFKFIEESNCLEEGKIE